MYLLTAASGRQVIVRSDELARSERIAGIDGDGRIVVDDFDARNPEKSGKFTDAAGTEHDMGVFMFGLTLCCQASDKGTESGVVCRACYGAEPPYDEGNYIYREPDGSFPELDPIASLTLIEPGGPVVNAEPRKVVIHRGPIPGTDVGHHWFDAADGNRYGVTGWPHGLNKGWSYEVVDAEARLVEDGMFSLAEIRKWAGWSR